MSAQRLGKLAVMNLVLVMILCTAAFGQQTSKETPAHTIPVGAVFVFKMMSKKPIKTARIEKEEIARVRTTEDKTIVHVVGLESGTTSLTLEDMDGKTETYRLVVVRVRTVPVGVALELQLPTKQPIGKATVTNEKIAEVKKTKDDPSKVLIEGLAVGATKITLAARDVKTEEYTVVVRKVNILIPVDEKTALQMRTKKKVVRVEVDWDDIVQVGQGLNDETQVIIHAKNIGAVVITLTDVEGNEETVEVGVKPKK
jgi:hypothetical protein